MPRPKKQQPERIPSVPITQSTYDNRFHGYLNAGKKSNGNEDIRHRSGATYEECAAKIIALEDEIAAKGVAPEVGKSMLLADFLRRWYAAGMRPRKQRDGSYTARWKYSTGRDYGMTIENYVIPAAGGWRLTEFVRTTKHAKDMQAKISEKHGEHAALKAHRVVSSALSDAEEDDLVYRNVMRAITPPSPEEADQEWLTVDEGKRILSAVASRKRLRSRWLQALAMGDRQGECLGLMWHRKGTRYQAGDIDLEKGTITVREKLLRKYHEHGCEDPVVCNKTRTKKDANGVEQPHDPCNRKMCGKYYGHGCGEDAKKKPLCGKKIARYCPARTELKGCFRHRTKDNKAKECPKPCAPDCREHASTCPKRKEGGGLVREDPKAKATKRTRHMPKPVWEAFKQRKAEQDRERKRAANRWTETGYVHTTELGQPLDPRQDLDEWYGLLAEAGVDPIKLHAARHYAVTILILLGVKTQIIMHLLGWSSDMTKRYGHIVDEMLKEAAGKIEGFFWPSAEPEAPAPPPFRKAPQQGRSSTDLSTGTVIQGPWKVA
jgi:integrase